MTGHQTETNEISNHPHILASSINLAYMFQASRGKWEYLERTHAYTGRTYKLHT